APAEPRRARPATPLRVLTFCFSGFPPSGSPPEMQAIMPRSVAEARPWANEPANPAPHSRQADHEPQSPDAPHSPRLRSPSRPIPPPPTARGDHHPRGGFRRTSASRPGGPHGPRTLRSALLNGNHHVTGAHIVAIGSQH